MPSFTDQDLQHIESAAGLARVEFHPEISSTNDRALELAPSLPAGDLPTLILAARQTAGRGRGDNAWWAADGALTFSLLIRTGDALPASRWPWMSLTVGLTVCESLSEILPGGPFQLKWPNDVFLDGKKVCGVLVELPQGGRETVVIGIGINVNNSFAAAPEPLPTTATSLTDYTGQAHSLVAVLVDVVQRLDANLRAVVRPANTIAARWRERCFLTGREVRIEGGNRTVEGTCQGISDDGAILIANAGGIHACVAGAVTKY